MRERSTDEKITLLSERIGVLEAENRRLTHLEQRLARLEAWSKAIGLSLGSLKGPD